MVPSGLEAGISVELAPYGATFTPTAAQVRIPAVLASLFGLIDGHPLRFDFHGPERGTGDAYVVLMFDLRTKSEIGSASSSVGFRQALEHVDWPNALGALTH
ncbi:hypothetical protein EDF23_102440 [Curtobacterium sp. PhB128]|nr:hypothetical protein EDF41_0913 [Curtobacterium sp. PhB171]ROQ25687.1 hypothetical protein EDF40_2185 [Curtobacterium sp. PhB170]ROS37140.1 hypothetical protein EDF25_1362 [Curtobacterium sp. PhB131]ROS71815.1 hypothetical protein EDF30_1548 [Curtobacterium sp. PhB141]TCL80047.1 hypothetical protein EDF23_102440 [Curtobacterium sp. PhB128]TCL97779.1 hypothetical protein EDF29_10210 [Curtobacterium sp. PhB138]